MKKTMNSAKTILMAFALGLLVFSGQLISQSLPASWNPDIVISGDIEIYVGESTQLSSSWNTGSQIDNESPNVTRQSWSVNGSFVQDGSPTVNDNAGSSSYLFDSTYSNIVGDYNVCFRIWHHSQALRDYTECVTVKVTEPPVLTCEGKDAPAIANEHYNDLFLPGDRDEEKRLQISSQISHRTDDETKAFDGIAKCIAGQPNPAYESAVKAAVDAILAGGSAFSWFW
jgi:hypothetical protein